MWLPPTPPSDDADECYIDTVMEMKYDTQVNISPAVLASIASFRFLMSILFKLNYYVLYSEEDYDVFGLRRQFSDTSTYTRHFHLLRKGNFMTNDSITHFSTN